MAANRAGQLRRYERAKRALDIVLAFTGLFLLWPVLLLALVAVCLDSPGRPLFVQVRVGRHGRRFRLYKLRTMVADAEQRLPELFAVSGLTGPVFKAADDPRVTRLGRWLRRTSLDELPQLLNVLLGDMSLVGPRPLPPAQIDDKDPRFRTRIEVLPGLTGQWQVTGRVMHFDYDRWLTQDCWYVEHRSMGLDIAILVRTIPAVIRARGAY